MRRVYVVRHGNTFAPGEPPRRIGGRTDISLVESGRVQAVALGDRFRNDGVRFDRCIAGPLRRTRETAALLLSRLAAPPSLATSDWLREIDHGPDENQPEAAVLARIGHAALDAWESAAVPPPGWAVDVGAARAAWRAFLAGQRKLRSGNCLVVTSNGIARFVLDDPRPKLRTGAWGVIAVGEGPPCAVEWDVRP